MYIIGKVDTLCDNKSNFGGVGAFWLYTVDSLTGITYPRSSNGTGRDLHTVRVSQNSL